MNPMQTKAVPPALEANNLAVKLGGKQVLNIAELQVNKNEVLVIIARTVQGKPLCFKPGTVNKTGLRHDYVPGICEQQKYRNIRAAPETGGGLSGTAAA